MKTLKEIRKEQKIPVKQITEKVGISRNSLWNYERGKREPSAEKVLKLAEVLGVDCETILKCFVDKETKKAE